MARTNERGLELTFHKASYRWCKVIEGKREYFGYGNGVSDRQSYQQALKVYRAAMDARELVHDSEAKGKLAGEILDSVTGRTFASKGRPLTTAELRDLVAAEAMPPAIAALLA